jgi:hypothetical protein
LFGCKGSNDSSLLCQAFAPSPAAAPVVLPAAAGAPRRGILLGALLPSLPHSLLLGALLGLPSTCGGLGRRALELLARAALVPPARGSQPVGAHRAEPLACRRTKGINSLINSLLQEQEKPPRNSCGEGLPLRALRHSAPDGTPARPQQRGWYTEGQPSQHSSSPAATGRGQHPQDEQGSI